MKSLIELGGDIANTQVAGLGILDTANKVLEGLGSSASKVASNLKTRKSILLPPKVNY